MESWIRFLDMVITARLDVEFGKKEVLEKPKATITFDANDPLGEFVKKWDIKNQDLVLLSLALLPHMAPGFLDKKIAEYIPKGGDFPEFGGIRAKNHRGIIPTGETLLYILAGNDSLVRKKYLSIFRESRLFQMGVICLGTTASDEPNYSGALTMDEEYAEKLLLGGVSKPRMSTQFPAQQIETLLKWEDLVLPDKTLKQIREIEDWLTYNNRLMTEWGLKNKVKPGYRVMFFGPPGTGKTLTVGLLGKHTGRDVFRIDLSLIISKYIGETEKQLSALFDKAANKDWILFFDEADALFGKRTAVRDAHDKYANQEVSYLLQRVETYSGLVILASNFKSNIDIAFTRRFQTIIEFELPGFPERLALWKNNLPENIPLETGIDLEELARKFPLTGSNIVNIVQQVGLKTLALNEKIILKQLLIEAVKNELGKEGKMH